MRYIFSGLSVSLLSLMPLSAAANTLGYYKTPDLNDKTLVVSSEGDLWRTGANGGIAVRLTTHPEVESHPSLSPDGNWIAFMASYDGPREIYMMPIAGGQPKRMTFEGGGVSLRGWLDGSRILYRTTNIPGTTPRLLRTLDRATLKTTDIPLADADEAALHSDGRTLAFTRFGLSIFSDNAVQYRGGRMAQLWTHTLGSTQEAVRLAADFAAPIRHPMWNGDRIFFVSDKSGTDNIWSVDKSGRDAKQHTQSTQWQMKSPVMHGGKIAYQSGADIYAYDIDANTTQKLNITLTSDGDYQRQRWLDTPLEFLSNASLNPEGESAVITARGHFTAAYKGDRRRISFDIPDDARARSAAYSHDGKSVYAILDQGMSGEIWKFPADGRGDALALTSGSQDYIWDIFPSPHDDGVLYTDKQGHLYHLDASTRAKTLMDTTQSGNDYAFGDFTWSAKGRYVAYTSYDDRDVARVTIYDTQSKQKHVVTTGKYQSYGPAFSVDGDWLYFISDRNFNASPGHPWGDRNMGPAFDDRSKVYALQLNPDAAFPFEPKDELTSKDNDKDEEKDKDSDDDGDKEKDAKKDAEADITFAGLSERLWDVPVPSGNYNRLAATKGHIFVHVSGRSPALKRLKISDEKPKLKSYASNVRGFSLSKDRKNLFAQIGRGKGVKFVITSSSSDFPSDTSDDALRLSDWKLPINPKQEWNQMVQDAWRLHRDFSYDPALRGVNWKAVRDHFIPMAGRIGHRSEMDDLMAQMSSELGILHSQIRSGEVPQDDESGDPAYLGADFTTRSNGLEIKALFTGETDRPHTLGPLLKSGMDFQNGDIITAIDGVSVRSEAELRNALATKAGTQVLVEYQRAGVAKEDIVEPASRRQLAMLRYGHWVQQNREAVAKTTNGKIGYIHLRAMGSNDLASFARDFYEHFDKDGLIIDVRGNRGGNVDSVIIGTLLRRAWAFWKSPHGGPASTNMQQTFRGHLAVLINEGTYSDGETFAAGIKSLDIAPLIGTTTAGAGIWLSDRNRIVDGGQARVAEFAQYGADGRWLIEGRGVSPDVEVNNAPMETYNGKDRQLERAIAHLEAQMTTNPVPELTPKPLPKLGTTGQDVD